METVKLLAWKAIYAYYLIISFFIDRMNPLIGETPAIIVMGLVHHVLLYRFVRNYRYGIHQLMGGFVADIRLGRAKRFTIPLVLPDSLAPSISADKAG